MSNDPTREFYGREAETYVACGVQTVSERLPAFLARLPASARVLELGCGAGRDSEAMIAAGFNVTPSDGTPEMAAIAEQRLGRPVRVLPFEEISEINAFDGIWANACLLHVPRESLAGVLVRIHEALRPGGVFFASYKTGGGEGLDKFGRYYNRPEPDWLRQAYDEARWADLTIETGHHPGYFGEPSDWLYVAAVKAG